MKGNDLLLLAAVGVGAYFLLKNQNASSGFSGGSYNTAQYQPGGAGGGSGVGTNPQNNPSNTQGNSLTKSNAGAVTLPAVIPSGYSSNYNYTPTSGILTTPYGGFSVAPSKVQTLVNQVATLGQQNQNHTTTATTMPILYGGVKTPFGTF
jgi:hypothetical protein